MDPDLIEFFNVVFRFVHIVAAIMWIGNSLLFTWMEINLRQRDDDPELLGYMNMLHGGGVFVLEKRVIKPEAIPKHLHKFMWQSYTTWISGFILLVTLFYTRADTLLLDPSQSDLTGLQAAGISLASLIGGWLVYDLLWRSPLKELPQLLVPACLLGLLAYASWLDGVFNPRAVYLQMGAMLGTFMSANVFFHIMPSQRTMMARLRDGKPHDLSLGKRAKVRSLHNHYITFPVIFLMLSAHFPVTYGSDNRIAIAGVIIVCLMLIKHCMNIYNTFSLWKEAMLAVFVLGTGAVCVLIANPFEHWRDQPGGQTAAVATASEEALSGRKLFQAKGCNACHRSQDSNMAPGLAGLIGKERSFQDGSKLIADEGYIRESILNAAAKVVAGYPPTMPSFATVLEDEEVDALVAFLATQ